LKLRKYTEVQLREAVASCFSYRQVLLKLGIKAAGGNYKTLQKAIAYFEIDNSHFTGQAWNRGKKIGFKRNINDYLTNKFPIQSSNLRRRLLKEGIFTAICSSCQGTEWQGEPMPLELDHINGCHEDNRLENLRLLCPNCHAQTSTYRGKNKKCS